MTDDVDPPPRRPRRRRRRRIGLAVALVALAAVIAWGVVAVVLLVEARDRAESGREALQALSGIDPLEADLDQVQQQVRDASEDLDVASANLTSPVLWPLRPMPVVGRQLASARALATTADEVVGTVSPVLDRVLAGRAAGSEPGARMQLLADLDADLSAASAALDDPDLGPDEALLAPLADARAEAAVELAELAGDVDDALTVVRGLRAFLDGSSYLILAANPAEMANAGGMYLSVGELQTSQGDFELAEFRRSSELFPVPSQGETDADIAARWGHLVPGNDFRKLGLTPRFATYGGPRSLEMWEASTGRRPEGAVVLDPVAIGTLLRVIGPVELEGQSYDAQSIIEYALVEQYEQFADNAVQEERRELVAEIAAAAVKAMGERSWDPFDLIRQLRPTAEGRHLLAYSEDPVQQELWSLIEVDGAIDGDELLVNLATVGGQKLDPFVHLDIGAQVVDGDGRRTVRLDVTVTNDVPDEVSEFAAGPWFVLDDAEPGTYLGRLAVFAPVGTTEVRFDPERTFEAYGRDGQLLVAASRVEIPPGTTETFTLDIDLADGVDQVTVIPSGRVPPITWRWGGETWQDVAARTVPVGTAGAGS